MSTRSKNKSAKPPPEKTPKPAPKKSGPKSPPKKRTDSKPKKAKNLRWWRRPDANVTPEQAEQMDCVYNEFEAQSRLFMAGKEHGQTVLTAQEARESKRIHGEYNERLAAILREEPKTEPQAELEAVINDPPLLRQPGATVTEEQAAALDAAAVCEAQPTAVPPVEPSTPTTPTTPPVETVEGVVGSPEKAKHTWIMEDGQARNFAKVSKLLNSHVPGLFQQEEGLLLVDGQQARTIATAKQLAPVIIDNIRIMITKNGKYHGDRIPSETLGNMLGSRHFLGNFRYVKKVVTTPIVLSNDTPSQPGYNAPDAILYLGPAVATAPNTDTIRRFLDLIEWASNADRTNAVAALLTVPFRFRFPGGKPLILVTASKSHSGKGTVIEFIRGKTARVELLYEDKDWPMQKVLHQQLVAMPQAHIINLDNVRADSSGRAKLIRSGCLESFITTADLVLGSATSHLRAIRTANHYLVLLNTNEGAVGADLLNRSLPIRLEAKGDLSERIARATEVLGCDIKLKWLPEHREQIDAEMWGMIERWLTEGKPLDKAVRHPMGPWAQTIGGILQVNGFTDFLLNYNATRATTDPVRLAIGILAFHAGSNPKRTLDLAKLATQQGLAKTLLPGIDPGNEAACQRAIGVTLSPYVDETCTARNAAERITYRLKKQEGRFEEGFPHFRYWFEEIKREPVSDNDLGGVVLEEADPVAVTPAHISPKTPDDEPKAKQSLTPGIEDVVDKKAGALLDSAAPMLASLDQYQPEPIPDPNNEAGA
jgi:hypothetical protein